jgi:uncharacterized membrane protein YecN with MAPEG domain
MAVPITAIYGAFHAVLNVALAVNVTRSRAKHQIFLGADHPEVLLAVRQHGNNAEYVPLALVLLLTAELSGGGAAVLHGVGAALSVGRLLHATGVGPKPAATRALGAVLTWGAIVTAGVYGLVASMR